MILIILRKLFLIAFSTREQQKFANSLYLFNQNFSGFLIIVIKKSIAPELFQIRYWITLNFHKAPVDINHSCY